MHAGSIRADTCASNYLSCGALGVLSVTEWLVSTRAESYTQWMWYDCKQHSQSRVLRHFRPSCENNQAGRRVQKAVASKKNLNRGSRLDLSYLAKLYLAGLTQLAKLNLAKYGFSYLAHLWQVHYVR